MTWWALLCSGFFIFLFSQQRLATLILCSGSSNAEHGKVPGVNQAVIFAAEMRKWRRLCSSSLSSFTKQHGSIKKQEAQLPQRNSTSAVHVYLCWLTDRAMHKTPQNRRGRPTIYFWHSNALIQEVLAENAFCHEIAAQGHSRSFTLQLFDGRQGVAYCHILLLAVSVKFSKT